MTTFIKANFAKHFFAVVCTVLFSSTVLLSATAPALAGEMADQVSVAAPLA